MSDRAAYMRAYRAAHPEYRRAESARLVVRRGPRVAEARERDQKRERVREGLWGPRKHSASRAEVISAGDRVSKFSLARFVAIDGEGMTDDHGRHRYVLLSASSGEELVDLEGIATSRALEFLCRVQTAQPRAILVCYGASYDSNMILGDVARPEIERLWAGEEINHGRYRIRYRPRRSLEVRRVGIPEWIRRKGRWTRNVEARFVLWDVIGFYQSTFLGALDDWFTPEERAALDMARIERGKARRSSFIPSELDEIRAYTRAELRALVVLMRRLQRALVDAGLKISRWDGAGAVAAALLKRENVKTHIGPVSDEMERLAQHAYFGGRIEAVRYGSTDKPVWQYDLHSAYPAAMTALPALAGGTWHRHEICPESVNGFALTRVRWTLSAEHEIYPFPYRDPFGGISYPPSGAGWYWWPEWEAADNALHRRRYDPGSTIEIEAARCFHPAERNARPFAFVPELYALRARWKAEGRASEKVLKLGLNSLYGKMAQQVGYRVEEGSRETKRPPFHSLLWAGYVTAVTRARAFVAAMERPDALVMFATDALFTTRELRGLEIGPGLGEWEETTHRGIVVAQSGVYWTMTAEGPLEHSRGFDPGALDPVAIRQAWREKRRSLAAPATRFVTMGAALDSGDDPICKVKDCPTSKRKHRVWAHWRTWRTIDRQLTLGPESKRQRIPRDRVRHPDRELVPTRATAAFALYPHLAGGCDDYTCRGSCPYPLLWRGEELPEPPSEDGSPLHILEADVEEATV